MAKSFYSRDEACEKLGMNAAQLKDLVRNGTLREFRDGGKVTFKADQVDKIADSMESVDLEGSSLGGSLGDFDMLSTAELTLEDTAGKTSPSGESMEIRFADDDDTVTDASADSKPGASSTGSGTLSLSADESLSGSSPDKMGSGDLILEPMEEASGSGLSLGDGSDVINLDDTTVSESKEDDKEGTVVTSVGVSVFDDDEVEVDADPLAQTVVSGDTGALGIDGVGSGSGLLDLTRESDDTSLGAELLDEIYPDDGGAGGEMGDATRAGLEADITETDDEDGTGFMPVTGEPELVAAGQAVTVVSYAEFPPDAVSTGLTGMMFVAVLTMCIAGLTAASAVKGVYPAILNTLAENNWIVGAGSLGAAIIALGIGIMIGKKSG